MIGISDHLFLINMADTIISEQNLDKLVLLLNVRHYRNYSREEIFFNGTRYVLFSFDILPQNMKTYHKNIFRGKTYGQIKNALSKTEFFYTDKMEMFFNVIILDICNANNQLTIESLTKKVDELTDKINLLVDVLTINKIIS